MTSPDTVARLLFVDRLLIAPSEAQPEPVSRYDEERDLTVIDDGTPLVESCGAGGTETFTKNDGERGDADFASSEMATGATQTYTAVKTEREDDDAPAALWGGTQLDTRQFPGDVEQD
jgi:hypothetical protein